MTTAEIIQNLLLGILVPLIPLTAGYVKLKQKGQNDLDLLSAENETKRTEAIQEGTAALVAHTETVRAVVHVLGESNTSSQVLKEAIGQVVLGYQSMVQDLSAMSKEQGEAKVAYDKYLTEVGRGMEEIHRRIDTALERRGEGRG